MVVCTDCGAGQFGGQRGQIARNRVAQDQAGASMGGCPEWLVLLVLNTMPPRGGTFCKADWAPRARDPFFSSHLRNGMQAKMEPQNVEFWVACRTGFRLVHKLACRFECTPNRVVRNIEKLLVFLCF